ncbi:hypothetical protein [Actinokineospora globicatena]|uniref:hypothetical protein n=1 Tax=Actinokineospora globicatena TaxID=103729 RepID=UPI0020A23A79|nr:hypothetical protein [Actinokineospora globicatena]MCP2304550.1 hypothetical protein [Actinokineospora globicatena]GLW78081.1 hypothetical protein Aglo01_25630 [Actinokineospora globicatena]GLW85253.1 hypothetical protein Aglo02_28930 [Actinokineospora globicatena]
MYSELFDAIGRGAGGWLVGWARAALAGVVSGDRAVAAVRHPLGFVCVPVYRGGDDGVCVHLWEPARTLAPPTTSPTHCHSWDLLSWVLVGGLLNQAIRVEESAAPTHRVFQVRSDAEGDTIEATDRLVRAHVAATTEHRAGESYTLTAGIFHETVIPDSERVVATVALGSSRPGAADLSLGGLHTADHRVVRQQCSRAETIAVATTVLAAIADDRVPG